MLGLGKTGTVRGSARGSPARSQEIYRHYAVALYRQALLNLDEPASAGHVACDALVNEYALAAMPELGEDDARYRLAESVFRRFRQLAAGPTQQDRRPGLFGGLGYTPEPAECWETLSVTWRPSCAVLRRLTTSPAAAVDDGDQAGGTAAGRR